jgi:hypothetical protein
VLIVSPAALLHPAVPQPDGTVLYELVTGHLVRAAHELVFLTDLAVELRAWPYGTWATLGLDPQAAAGAVITAWQLGHLKGPPARRADRRGGLGIGAAGHDPWARPAPRAACPAAPAGLAPVAAPHQRTPPRATAFCSGGHPPAAAGSAWRTPQDHVTARSARTVDTGHRRSRPVGRTRTRSQAAADTTADRPATALQKMAAVRAPACGSSGLHVGSSTAVAGGSGGPDRVRVRPHEVAWLRWLPQGPLLFTLVAGAREAAGHPSGLQIAANTGMAIDTSLATCAGHQPSGGRLFRKQRTVNPLMVPAHYNFLYCSSRPALRTAEPVRGAGLASREAGPCPIHEEIQMTKMEWSN